MLNKQTTLRTKPWLDKYLYFKTFLLVLVFSSFVSSHFVFAQAFQGNGIQGNGIQGSGIQGSGIQSTKPQPERTQITGITLAHAAKERLQYQVTYDGRYVDIDYPNGDVPSNIGVCTDVVIRSYRSLGLDLQALVHMDMKSNFEEYPSKRIWGMTRTDTNIDHRRVPNLQTFFKRKGESLLVSSTASDYRPGDIVSWMLPGNLPHIGIISDKVSEQSNNPLVIHNIGSDPKLEDMLFDYKITGHYRYLPTPD